MFCSECGTKNEKNANFCENCGTKIEKKGINKEKTTKNKVKEKFQNKKISKRKKCLFVILIGIIIILIILYMLISYRLSPEAIAKDYFLAVMNADMNKLYRYTDCEENEFMNQAIFEKISGFAENPKKKITNYKITSVDEDESGLYTTVTIYYMESDSDDYKIAKIRLLKQYSKKFLFFDDWRIHIDELDTVDDYTIKVFKNSKVKIEEIEISEKYIDKNASKENYDVYKIPKLFAGKYRIQIEMPVGILVEDTIRVSNYSSYTQTIDQEDLTDSAKEVILDTIKIGLQTLYNGAIEKKAFTEIQDALNCTEDASTLESVYTSFVHDLENTGLTNIEFTDLEMQSIRTNIDGSLRIIVKANYKYKLTDSVDEEVKVYEGNQSSTMQIYLVYQENKFKFIDGLNLNTNFSK